MLIEETVEQRLSAGAADLLHLHLSHLLDGRNDRRGVDRHRRWPRAFDQRIARDKTDGGSSISPARRQHQQQAVADHVAQRSIGRPRLPGFAHFRR